MVKRAMLPLRSALLLLAGLFAAYLLGSIMRASCTRRRTTLETLCADSGRQLQWVAAVGAAVTAVAGLWSLIRARA